MKKFFALVIFLLMFAAQASAMNLTIYESVGSIGLSAKQFEIDIKDYARLYGNFSKGVAVFNEDLFFHFDATLLRDKVPQAKSYAEEQKIFNAASRFGGEDFSNTVPVFVFEGLTKIYPIIDEDDGRKFYLLATETGGGSSMKLISARTGDGKWIQYFDTLNMRKKIPHEFYLEDFYAEGDTIIFLYKEWQKENYCKLQNKWNPSLLLFNAKIIS